LGGKDKDDGVGRKILDHCFLSPFNEKRLATRNNASNKPFLSLLYRSWALRNRTAPHVVSVGLAYRPCFLPSWESVGAVRPTAPIRLERISASPQTQKARVVTSASLWEGVGVRG
jgi:hypothetical protein